MSIIEKSVTIAAPIEAVFDFHTDTNNLRLISPPWIAANVVRQEGEGKGKIIELRIIQFGVFPSRWHVSIDEFERPFRITDLMLSGPMKYFRHTRHLTQPCASLTELVDHVEYVLPFGAIGRIADKLSVHQMMDQMFEYRHKKTKEILEKRFYIADVPLENVGAV